MIAAILAGCLACFAQDDAGRAALDRFEAAQRLCAERSEPTGDERTAVIVAALSVLELGGPDRPASDRLDAVAECMLVHARALGNDDALAAALATAAQASIRDERFERAITLLEPDVVQGLAERNSRFGPFMRIRFHEALRKSGAFDRLAGVLEPVDAALANRTDDDAASARALLYGERVELARDWGLPDVMLSWNARELEAAHDAEPSVQSAAELHRVDCLLAVEDLEGAADEAERLMKLAHDRVTIARLRFRCALARIARAGREHGPSPDAEIASLRELAEGEDLDPCARRAAAWWLADGALMGGDSAEALRRATSGQARAPIAGDVFDAVLRATVVRSLIKDNAPVERLEAARRELDVAAAAMMDAWRRIPPDDGGLGFLHFNGRCELLAALLSADRAIAERAGGPIAPSVVAAMLDRVLAAQELGTLTRLLGGTRASVDALRRDLLGPGEGLLVFLPAGRGTHVFALDASTLLHAEVAGTGALRDACDALVESVVLRPRDATAERPRATAAGRAFAHLLLDDAIRARVKQWNGIAICGLDLIGYAPVMPVAALVVEGEAPLGISHALRILPSVPLALTFARRERARDARRTIALCAATTPEPPFAALPLDEDAARKWVGADGTERCVFGKDATRAALADLARQPIDALVIVAHGARDATRRRPACLVLAAGSDDDGWLDADGVASMPSPDTVVLAVCGAGAGPKRLGDDGVQTLGSAYFRAGARSVIQSSAEIDYAATMLLLEPLLAQLRAGRPVAEALQAARREVAARPGMNHPYFTCLLEAYGR